MPSATVFREPCDAELFCIWIVSWIVLIHEYLLPIYESLQIRMAIERGRKTRADIGLGVCGEHGGDPTSIAFFDKVVHETHLYDLANSLFCL